MKICIKIKHIQSKTCIMCLLVDLTKEIRKMVTCLLNVFAMKKTKKKWIYSKQLHNWLKTMEICVHWNWQRLTNRSLRQQKNTHPHTHTQLEIWKKGKNLVIVFYIAVHKRQQQTTDFMRFLPFFSSLLSFTGTCTRIFAHEFP